MTEPEPVEITLDPDLGFVPGGFMMPPDFEDSWMDEVKEAQRQGNTHALEELVRRKVNEQLVERLCEAFHPLLTYVSEAHNPRLAADVAAYSSRLKIRDGWTGATIASKYGLSRTAVREHIEKFCKLFGLPVPDERDGRKNAESNRPNQNLSNE